MPHQATRKTPRQKLSKLPPYEYRHLENHQFRLIHLHPGKRKDPIVVSVDSLPLVNNRYTAISYVWGDTARIHRIYANDCQHVAHLPVVDCTRKVNEKGDACLVGVREGTPGERSNDGIKERSEKKPDQKPEDRFQSSVGKELEDAVEKKVEEEATERLGEKEEEKADETVQGGPERRQEEANSGKAVAADDGGNHLSCTFCPTKPTGYLKVTASLFNVLLNLRSDTMYRTYWVDSLCINQDDLNEKAHQVERMRKIYGLAHTTVAYPGDSDEVMQLAFLAIRALAKLKDAKDVPWNLNNVLPVHLAPAKRNPQWYRTTTPIKTAWQAFMAFLQLPWFHRIWVVQEVVSSREIEVCAGTGYLPWRVLIDACTVVSKSMLHTLDFAREQVRIPLYLEEQRAPTRAVLDRSLGVIPVLDPFSYVTHERDRLEAELVTANFFYKILLRTRGCGASDPRDHIFALMGIGKGAGDFLPPVDYTLSVTDVFTRTAYAWYMVMEPPTLSFLLAVNGSYDQEDLPSWVPDWRRPWNIEPIVNEKVWRASWSILKHHNRIEFPDMTAPKLTIPLTLKVRGCRLLTIKDLEDIKAHMTSHLKRHAQLINQFSEPYPTTYLSYKDAFGHTVQPVHEGGFSVQSARSEGFWAYRNASRDRKRLRPLFPRDASKFRQAPSPLVASFFGKLIHISTFNDGASRGPCEPQYTQEQLYSHISSVFRWPEPTPYDRHAKSRKWFITEDGFMGLTIYIAQPGDTIVYLFGGDTPHVLRQKSMVDGKIVWGYVGEAFVFGLMEGEVEHDLPDDVIEDFEIQ